MTGTAGKKEVQGGSEVVQTNRAIDPNIPQRLASMPDHSVWVGASAGSGKTKVLTDRVLRLLLPRRDGRPGTPPHKIVCITFTKAAAGEMALRIARTLGEWSVLPLDGPAKKTLVGQLRTLLGHEPAQKEISAARRLFAEVVDTPGGLQIMTIHSFCQSVLGRFPLEAGLLPHFKVLEERESQALLTQARDAVLNAGDPFLTEALEVIASQVNNDQFMEILSDLTSERYQLRRLLDSGFGVDGLYTALCAHLSVTPGKTAQSLLSEHCRDSDFPADNLRQACRALLDSTPGRASLAASISDWLSLEPKERAANFKSYAALYLTQEGNPSRKIFTDAFFRDEPETAGTLITEARRIMALLDKLNAAECALLSRHLTALGKAMIEHYQDLKERQAVLDFDDLITFTLRLLQRKDMAAWVQYKLDQGIDHILIDEAQDTNPEQWAIVESLTEEIAAGQGARDVSRSVFTVGDEKQSIYSFQRASPEEFRRMQKHFAARLPDLHKIDLNISFRSTQSVLQAVDAVFEIPQMREGLGLNEIKHISHRLGQEGIVELWPLVRGEEESEDPDPWAPPVAVIEKSEAASRLAAEIARRIKLWLDQKEILPARGRPLKPGDILILFRTRGMLFHTVARALKTAGIPVSGMDRMILNRQIAVQDMLALAEIALLPLDDLTLATVLKSPLIGWNDDKLYDIAFGRKTSLWDRLRQEDCIAEFIWLERLVQRAGSLPPYEFFAEILYSPCPADSVSGLRAFRARLGDDAPDPLNELLNIALDYQRDHIPSLQQFLHWQKGQQGSIRREMEEAGNEVRLMTVHGAKGLQAPVVILPDTMPSSSAGNRNERRLLWPSRSGLPALFWCPRANLACQAFNHALQTIATRQEEEERRLLYVAMTRAEDRLYIAGYERSKTLKPQSWYAAAQSAMQSADGVEFLSDGTLRLHNAQIKNPDRMKTEAQEIAGSDKIPDFFYTPAPPEPAPPKPLSPSRMDEEDTAQSPLAGENSHRFRRGNLTHKLLQYLPELPLESRLPAARAFLERHAADLPEEIRNSIATETLAVLTHADFAPIFGPGSQAEIPVTGLVDGRVISGQIDRLLVTENEILIIDYKTNRPPPRDPAAIPKAYRTQMFAYASALRAIYPDKAVRGALLWTDGSLLMPLDF